MTPVKQQHAAHRPQKGDIGDCLEACLASQLDLPVSSVPKLAEGLDYYTEANIGEFLKRARAWLATMGISLWGQWLRADSLEQALEIQGRINPGLRYILCGASRTEGVNHAVCARGGEIEHDPHPRPEITGIRGPLWPHRKVFGILVVRETV